MSYNLNKLEKNFRGTSVKIFTARYGVFLKTCPAARHVDTADAKNFQTKQLCSNNGSICILVNAILPNKKPQI